MVDVVTLSVNWGASKMVVDVIFMVDTKVHAGGGDRDGDDSGYGSTVVGGHYTRA